MEEMLRRILENDVVEAHAAQSVQPQGLTSQRKADGKKCVSLQHNTVNVRNPNTFGFRTEALCSVPNLVRTRVTSEIRTILFG